MRNALLAICLLALAASAPAHDAPAPPAESLRQAASLSRFSGLHTPSPAGADRFAVVGLGIATEGGQANLAIQQIQATRAGKTTLIDNIKATTPMALTDAYMNNPAGALIQALLVKGEVRIDRIENSGAAPRRDGDPQGVKDVLVKIANGAFEGTVSMGLVRAKATGSLAYDAQTRKLVVTVTGVSAGVPIGLDKVFEQLAAAFTYDWTVVAKPKVTVLVDEMFR